jgi:hypothetical protein
VRLKKGMFVVFFLVYMANLCFADVYISEIMYNPLGSDTDREWVEIYNNGSAVNLSEWKFLEANVNHGLTLVNGSFVVNDYAVIVDDASVFLGDYPTFNGTLFDSSFSLSNTGETIALVDENVNVVDNLTYSSSVGANGNGMTLVRDNVTFLLIEGNVSGGSPGSKSLGLQSEILSDVALEVYLEDIIYLNVNYDKLFKIININYGLGEVYNITVYYDITRNGSIVVNSSFIKGNVNQYSTLDTGDFFTTEAGEYVLCGAIINSSLQNEGNTSNNLVCKNFTVIDSSIINCNISLSVSTNKTLYQEGEKISYDLDLNNETFPFIIEYGVFDLLGTAIRDYRNTTNTNAKTYTPNIDELDRIMLIKANLANVVCNDTNLEDNSVETMILVNGSISDSSSAQGTNESNFIIESITPSIIKFGDLIKVKIDVYKGNTNKYSTSVYVENNEGDELSKSKSKFNVYDKMTNYKLTIPVQLEDNCGNDFDDGNYNVVIEGLDSKITKVIMVEESSSFCNNDQEIDIQSKKGVDYEVIDFTKTVKSGETVSALFKIINNDFIMHDFSIWSYVYLGAQSLTGTRKYNQQNISLSPRSSTFVSLETEKIEEVEPGEYKLRFNIKKDNLKNLKSITEPILVMQDEEEITYSGDELIKLSTAQQIEDNDILESASFQIGLESPENVFIGKREYISKLERIRSMLPTFVIFVLLLIEVAVILKKN